MSTPCMISIIELKSDFYRLIEEVSQGRQIIVTKRGKAMAKLELTDPQACVSTRSKKRRPEHAAARARPKKS
jgi:antitoxin (DNA-binding transcriptional repressor) of toxin-antitoxin stability system